MSSEGCLAEWCRDEEWCSVTCTAELLGRKWHPVIVHRLLTDGPSGFNDLQEAIDDISSNVLSGNLEELGEEGLVEREIISEKPFRVEYSLTERGEDLAPVIDAMAKWGEKHAQPA
ncbi:MAG: winged helix-turn-helix transcriptional regulator [Halolamina sp.]